MAKAELATRRVLLLHLAVEHLAQQGHTQRVIIKHGSLQICDACHETDPGSLVGGLQEFCDVDHFMCCVMVMGVDRGDKSLSI